MWTNRTRTSAICGGLLATLLLLADSIGRSNAVPVACPTGAPYPPPPVERALGEMPGIQTITVNMAPSGKLLTLTMLDSNTGDLIPIARSYDGRKWEVAPGPYAHSGEVGITCGTSNCEVDLSAITTSGPVKETTYTAYLNLDDETGKKARAARFLEQATFGASLEDIDDFMGKYGDPSDNTFAAWVADQVDSTVVPVTSHREFYRRHTNPRWDRVSWSARPTKSPCDQYARWRTIPLISRDSVRNSFSVTPLPGDSTKWIIQIDGEPRTVVSSIEMEEGAPALVVNTAYAMCNPDREFWQEAVGQPFPEIRINGNCYTLKNGAPSLQVAEIEDDIPMLDLTGAVLAPIDNVAYDSLYWTSLEGITEYILQEKFVSAKCSDMASLALGTNREPGQTIFGKVDGQYLVYDPRLVLEQNTVESPLPDGGGLNSVLTNGQMECSNAPRSFLNEDHCRLSTDTTACSATVPVVTTIELNSNTIQDIIAVESELNHGSKHIYAFVDIPITDETDADGNYYLGYPPCWEWHWDEPVNFQRVLGATECISSVHRDTETLFAKYLRPEFDDPFNPNPVYKTVRRRRTTRCAKSDEAKFDLGYITGQDGTCWKHVHKLEGSIFDMTYWFENNLTPSINNWARGTEANVLSLKDTGLGNKWIYEEVEWMDSRYNKLPGHLYDFVEYDDLPDNLKVQALEDRFGQSRSNDGGTGVVVCGSVGEVANDPMLGEGFQYAWEGFRDELDVSAEMDEQRHTIWAYLALNAPDQLRQRMAWALSQINVVGFGQLDDGNTEAVLQYYDIFVWHAFGSYKDIMKKVAFSDAMAEFLSSVGNKSFQYSQSRGIEAFPDENFAREMLQLFTVGLVRLNMDGSPVIGNDGRPVETYSNVDLISYSRAWTGLERPDNRANNDGYWSRVDPMIVENEWHDVFPKTDLLGGYIGDRNYPLCTDLPKNHALRKGATYRLLGSKNSPELLFERQYSWSNWGEEPSLERLEISGTSPLYQVLCAANDSTGECTYPGKVVLDVNLDYSNPGDRSGAEFVAESLRTIRVKSGADAIYYEYVRQSCVELSFFKDGVKVEDQTDRVESTDPRVYTASSSMCADPRRDVATESCCDLGFEEGNSDWRGQGFKFCNFFGERMSYDNAVQRCAVNGKQHCTTQRWEAHNYGYCGHEEWYGHYFSWTSKACSLKAKINLNKEVAIVHDVQPDFAGNSNVWPGVAASSRNFFMPAWIHEFDHADCASSPSCEVVPDGCLCDVMVDENVAFNSAPSSKEDILSECFIGALDPEVAPEQYSVLSCDIPNVIVYGKNNKSTCSRMGTDVIFQYIDEFGIPRHVKNMRSTVEIDDRYSFRTPVQFLSFIDPELRDTMFEFEAVLDSMFYHPNHPPFLAKRLLQRFGHSNPSPELIKTVAEAYKKGDYNGIGSRKYGDLGALTAAMLLHPESTSISLTSDPTFGQMREPLVKIVSFMRALNYKHDSPLYIPLLDGLGSWISQGTYEQPSVFNYYLPEFTPPGPIGGSGLYSPETQILSGAAITNLLDGMFRMVKNGLDDCDAGFANYGPLSCERTDGETSSSLGALGYTNESGSHQDVLDDLAITLTANRLDKAKRDLILVSTANDFLFGDRNKAIRSMMQLIVSTAEFQTTGLAKNTPVIREKTEPTEAASSDYKAVVFLMFYGGMDSWNMLAPKGDCHADYLDVRGSDLAVPLDKLLNIDAAGSGQTCNEFGINDAFPFAKEQYDEGNLLFFANMGVLQQPVDKTNYEITQSNLFSHNSQQYALQKLDIKSILGDTGVGGRLMDALSKRNYKTSSNSVDSYAHVAAGDPNVASPTRQLSSYSPQEFNRYPTKEYITDRVKQLNGISSDKSSNSRFGETWSARLMQAFEEGDEAFEIYENSKFDIADFRPSPTPLDRKFQTTARYIKSRAYRNVDRELFVIGDGGYDMHECNCVADKLAYINFTLKKFKEEMVAQGMWDKIVIVTGSDFGRTLTPNSGGGTDHAWAGHYFMMGGDVKGKQIMGTYPDVTEASQYRLESRGRMVPTTPFDAMWNGVAQWMGVSDEQSLDSLLPDRKNFPKCMMFTDSQLFDSGSTPEYTCDAQAAAAL